MLGDGIAIDPTLGELHAPSDGVVIGLHDCKHAVTIRADNGAEILLHVGLDTVRCAGAGFTALVAIGAAVKAGDLLLRFDMDMLARNAASLMSPVVVINSHAFAIEDTVTGREVAFGEPIMTVRPLAAQTDAPASEVGEPLRRRVRVGLAHGLHARPAALVARAAAAFAAELAIEIGGRRANARSPVSVMALAVRAGDEVDVVAMGADAAAALQALAEAMADGQVAEPAPLAPEPVQAALTPSPLAALSGVAAAPGLAIGAAVRLIEPEVVVRLEAARRRTSAPRCPRPWPRSRGARGRLAAETGQGREIAEAHLAFLTDPELRQGADAAIVAGASAGVAWRGAIGGFVDQLSASGDARMLERAADLADLRRQVLLRLSGETASRISLPDNAIVIADDLLPSQLMDLEAARVAGLAISRGGPTSHVAILAAAMNVPAVVALGARVLSIEDGALVILDGDEGRLQVAPNPAEIATAQTRLFERRERRARAQASAREPCRMADGKRIEVFANLGAVAEAGGAVENGAEGCGLLRTEFLFMDRTTAPDEAEQQGAYQAIADALDGRPLVIRTLDAGADKPVSYLPLATEANPALGVRGIRVSLAWPELLRAQVRAILRVSPAGQARILLPMIASLSEVRAARACWPRSPPRSASLRRSWASWSRRRPPRSPPTCSPPRPTSSPSAPTTSPSTRSPWTARTRGSPPTSMRCIRPCCGWSARRRLAARCTAGRSGSVAAWRLNSPPRRS